MPHTSARACSPTAGRSRRAELLCVSRASTYAKVTHRFLERGLEFVGPAIIGEDDLQCLLCLIDIAG
jgi:hypothetical protein